MIETQNTKAGSKRPHASSHNSSAAGPSGQAGKDKDKNKIDNDKDQNNDIQPEKEKNRTEQKTDNNKKHKNSKSKKKRSDKNKNKGSQDAPSTSGTSSSSNKNKQKSDDKAASVASDDCLMLTDHDIKSLMKGKEGNDKTDTDSDNDSYLNISADEPFFKYLQKNIPRPDKQKRQ